MRIHVIGKQRKIPHVGDRMVKLWRDNGIACFQSDMKPCARCNDKSKCKILTACGVLRLRGHCSRAWLAMLTGAGWFVGGDAC